MWEYQKRFGKEHGCFQTMCQAMTIYHDRLKEVDGSIYDYKDAKDFARAMPDEFKYDDTIDTFTAYKRYIASSLGSRTTIVVFLSVNLIGFDYA